MPRDSSSARAASMSSTCSAMGFLLGLLAFEWVKHARPAPGRTTSRRKLQRFSRIETLRSMAFRLLHELYRLRCIAQSMLRRLAKRDRGPRATAATHTNGRSATMFPPRAPFLQPDVGEPPSSPTPPPHAHRPEVGL